MSNQNVYLLWDCDDCGRKGIPCSPEHRYCPDCGGLRTFAEQDEAYLPGNDETWDSHSHHIIPDDVYKRLQRAGASWFCTNCKADNYGDEENCHHCDAPRKATSDELLEHSSFNTFKTYMDGDEGATADLTEIYGEYGGLRASEGLSFNMDDSHEGQLERAQEGRSAFASEMRNETHESRPKWDKYDLPSSVESHKKFEEQKREEEQRQKQSVASRIAHEERVRELKSQIRSINIKKHIGLVLLFMILFFGLVFVGWGFSTYETTGQITDVYWKRQIQEQRWTNTTKSDWDYNIVEKSEIKPTNGSGERAGAQIIGCYNKHHHYQDYVCGTKKVSCSHMQTKSRDYPCTKSESYQESYSCSKQESYTCGQNCSTRRNSNGTASRSCSPKYCSRSVPSTCYRTRTRSVPSTCTKTWEEAIHDYDIVDKICERSIEKPYCEYKTQVWINSQHYEKSDHTSDPVWPNGSLEKDERQIKSESYSVSLNVDGEIKKKTLSFGEFQKWKKGDSVRVIMTNFGWIVDIKI